MPTYDPSNATCHIFTFKDGILSSLAHDLKLQAEVFQIRVAAQAKGGSRWRSVHAVIDAASLRTVCAMKNGKRSPRPLSENDRNEIDQNIRTATLCPDKYPVIRFCSRRIAADNGGIMITGDLTLCGVTRPLILPVRELKTSTRMEIMLDQRDFGIKPFSALMGAMQVKPEILIKIEIKS